MTRGIVTALTTLLVVHGATFAQEYGPDPVGDPDPRAGTCAFWASGEYLVW
jgi:hypothetical protein